MTSVMQEIPLAKVQPAKDNIRRRVIPDDHDDTRCSTEPCELCALANSIRQIGLLQPLVVRKVKGKGDVFELVAGHRRRAALELAGATSAECVVRTFDGSPLEYVVAMYAENEHRKSIDPMEEAFALLRLRDEAGWTQEQIAEQTGRSQGHVSKRLALATKLPARFQTLLDKGPRGGGIAIADADALCRLPDAKAMDEAWAVYNRSRHYMSSLVEAVKDVEAQIERQRKIDEATERLQREGVKVVERPQYGWYSSSSKVRKLGKGYGEVPIARTKHAAERCHGAVVERDGEVVYVCTNPQRHGISDASPASAARRAEDAKGKLEARQLKEAREARWVAMRSILSKKPRVIDGLSVFVARQLVDAANVAPSRVACQILELEVPAVKQGSGASHRDWHGVLVKYSRENDANAIRAGIALAFGEVEDRIGQNYVKDWTRHRRHFDFLVEQAHYQLAVIERDRLKIAKAAAA